MDINKWPNVNAVAAELGCSTKTISRYVARGALTKRVRPRAGLVSEVVYDPTTVARLKARLLDERERELAKVSLAVEPDTPETAETVDSAMSVPRPDSLGPVLAALGRLPRQWALYLSWDDARAYTGLSMTALRSAVAEGSVGTRAYGRGVRLRRRDLERL